MCKRPTGLGVLGMDATLKLKAVGFNVAGWSETRQPRPGSSRFANRTA